MIYLYRPAPDVNNGKHWQSSTPPTVEQTQLIIDGELEVFRFVGNTFEMLEPIDENDPDSWGEIPFIS